MVEAQNMGEHTRLEGAWIGTSMRPDTGPATPSVDEDDDSQRRFMLGDPTFDYIN